MVRLLARGGNPLTRAASAIQGNARNKVNQTTAANTKHPTASTQITVPIRRNARSSLLRILWGDRRGSSLASVFRDVSLGMAKPFRRWRYFSDTMPEKGKRRAARSRELPTCLSQLKAFTNWRRVGTLTTHTDLAVQLLVRLFRFWRGHVAGELAEGLQFGAERRARDA